MAILFLDCFSSAAPLNGEGFSTSLSPLLFLWQNTDGPLREEWWGKGALLILVKMLLLFFFCYCITGWKQMFLLFTRHSMACLNTRKTALLQTVLSSKAAVIFIMRQLHCGGYFDEICLQIPATPQLRIQLNSVSIKNLPVFKIP